MDITLDRKDLLRALLLAVRRHHRFNNTVLLTASESGLTLHVNRDMTLFLNMTCTTVNPGEVVIDDKILYRLLRIWTSRRIRLFVDENKLHVWGDGKTTLPTFKKTGLLGMDDFSTPIARFEMQINDLRRMVSRVIVAAYPDPKVQKLHAVECKLGEGFLSMAATNSYLLSVDRAACSLTENIDFLAVSLQTLLSLPFVKAGVESTADETIILEVTHYHLRVKSSTFTVLLPIIHEPWGVAYKHLLHCETQTSITVDSLTLRRHIDLMRFAQFIRWTVNDDGLKLHAKEKHGCVYDVHLEVDFAGEPVTLFFDAPNLLACLGQSPKQIKFEIHRPNKPIRITNGNHTFVIMPMEGEQ